MLEACHNIEHIPYHTKLTTYQYGSLGIDFSDLSIDKICYTGAHQFIPDIPSHRHTALYQYQTKT